MHTDQMGKQRASRYETELERESAEYYEHRRKFWKKLNAGDWWIAVAVYLLLSSVAFVVL